MFFFFLNTHISCASRLSEIPMRTLAQAKTSADEHAAGHWPIIRCVSAASIQTCVYNLIRENFILYTNHHHECMCVKDVSAHIERFFMSIFLFFVNMELGQKIKHLMCGLWQVRLVTHTHTNISFKIK